MTTLLKRFGWPLLAVVLMVVVLAGLALVAIDPLSHGVLNINGEEFHLAQLHGGHWLGAMAGLAVAGVVVLFVLPVALLVPLLVVAALLLGLLALAAGVAALVFSPLLLVAGIAWLIWRSARRQKPATADAATPAATPATPATPAATILE